MRSTKAKASRYPDRVGKKGPPCFDDAEKHAAMTAPWMEPMPPKTAAMKAFMPGKRPMKGWIWG